MTTCQHSESSSSSRHGKVMRIRTAARAFAFMTLENRRHSFPSRQSQPNAKSHQELSFDTSFQKKRNPLGNRCREADTG